MRIAIAHWSRRKVGGAETHLEQAMAALHARGHELACLFEADEPAAIQPMALPPGVSAWNVRDPGVDAALRALEHWQPDVIYTHILLDPGLEERLLDMAPAVFYAHNYYGTCISGHKAHAFPAVRPCAKRFGAVCLLHYFPRRCGGLSPVTMWRGYAAQARRLRLLPRYARLLVASEHMALEYQRHGLRAEVVPYWTDAGEEPQEGTPLASAPEIHLLFVGRMERLKGGSLLLDALPSVAAALRKPLVCHFAGAGQAEAAWREQAADLQARCPQVRVEFHGWLAGADRAALLRRTHLLVVPSVWPEPFGLVGLEAGAAGVPAAAFAVGGIGEWLKEGVNGTLAPGQPPRAEGLAAAVVRALADPTEYQKLRTGAFRAAREEFSQERHLARVERVLQQAGTA